MSLLNNFHKHNKRKLRRDEIIKTLGPFGGALILVACLIIVSHLYGSAFSQQGYVLSTASGGYEKLNSALQALNAAKIGEAGDFFKQANFDFKNIENTLLTLSQSLKPLSEERLTSALHLARAGSAISSSGQFLSGSLKSLLTAAPALTETITLDSTRGDDEIVDNNKAGNIHDPLKRSLSDLDWAYNSVSIAAEELASVNLAVMPDDLKPSIAEAQSKIITLKTALSVLRDYTSLFVELSEGYQKNYLLLFQNTAETRPTGGFIGTYGNLRLKQGRVQSLLVESVYELDGRLTKKVEPPAPLRNLGVEAWAMRDANWWPDFEVSAQKISYFYELEAGETPDGVFIFTPAVFEKILEVVGPVQIPEHDVTISADNFYETIQTKTSVEYDKKENKPKSFIADVAKVLFAKLPELNETQKLKIFGSLLQSIYHKDIMAYSRHNNLQTKFENLGLDGKITNLAEFETADYLLISNANVGGGKTDKFIQNSAVLTTSIDQLGKAQNTLKITRVNTAPEDFELSTNRSYTRIYVPKGSILESADIPVHVFEELDRTVFSYQTVIEAGDSKSVTLTYRLSSDLQNIRGHSVIFEKNPGQSIDKIHYRLILPRNAKIAHTVGSESVREISGGYDLEIGKLINVKYVGIVFK